MQWHFKLGHTGFYIVPFILRQGCLGNLVENMGRNNVNIPMCEYFHYRKQERNPKSGTRKIKYKEDEGSLNRNQFEPGKLTFSYQ